jgi:hypothetical protein
MAAADPFGGATLQINKVATLRQRLFICLSGTGFAAPLAYGGYYRALGGGAKFREIGQLGQISRNRDATTTCCDSITNSKWC